MANVAGIVPRQHNKIAEQKMSVGADNHVWGEAAGPNSPLLDTSRFMATQSMKKQLAIVTAAMTRLYDRSSIKELPAKIVAAG